MNRKSLIIITALITLCLIITPASAELIIVHTNDVHGNFDTNIGYAGLAAFVNDCKSKGDTVLLFDDGDFIQGTGVVSFTNGNSAIDLMNKAGYCAAEPGNHEFDYGIEQILELRDKAEFPILAANIFYADTHEPVFLENTIIEADNLKIGVFGLDTPDTMVEGMPRIVSRITISGGDEMYSIAQNQVDKLKKQGCDMIICLAHLGVDETSKPNRSVDLADNVNGIDLIIDGHSHTEIPNGMVINDTLIVSTGCYLKNIGVVRVAADKKLSASLVSNYTKKDAGVEKAVKEYIDAFEKEYSEIIGNTPVFFNGNKTRIRSGESNLGNLVADAYIWNVKRLGYLPDTGIIISGTIRANLETGNISRKDIINILPYGNILTVSKLPGKLLLMALEDSCSVFGDENSGFPQVSGMEFTIDASKNYVKGENNRVSIQSINGQPFDENKIYLIATNEFISSVINSQIPSGIDDTIYFNVTDSQALSEFIKTGLNGTIPEKYAKPQGRITIINSENSSGKPVAESAASPMPALGIPAALCAALILLRKNK